MVGACGKAFVKQNGGMWIWLGNPPLHVSQDQSSIRIDPKNLPFKFNKPSSPILQESKFKLSRLTRSEKETVCL